MSRRLFDVGAFGFTEEQWAALPEDRRKHFRSRARYQRLNERLRTYQREYARRKQLEKRK